MMRTLLTSLTKIGYGWNTVCSASKSLAAPKVPSRAFHAEEFQKLDAQLSRIAHESVKLRKTISENPMEGKTLDSKTKEELEKRIQKNQEKIFQLKLHLRVAANRAQPKEEAHLIV